MGDKFFHKALHGGHWDFSDMQFDTIDYTAVHGFYCGFGVFFRGVIYHTILCRFTVDGDYVLTADRIPLERLAEN